MNYIVLKVNKVNLPLQGRQTVTVRIIFELSRCYGLNVSQQNAQVETLCPTVIVVIDRPLGSNCCLVAKLCSALLQCHGL